MNLARTVWLIRGISLFFRPAFTITALGLFSGAGVCDADPFAENIRSTPPRSPEQERLSFHLPSGFEIQLFAAEPDIFKPMNMAFDDRGRLWVTVTQEYPYAVPLEKEGRDEIRIFEDTNGDGRADRITTFADGLNIPIGIYPYKKGVIAWSIPHIWYLEDIDGDGRADKREILYGPLGWDRDTHGMNSSFVRGFDGWLYATHGFNNNTTVKGRDGHEISMNSGNTYRFRLDGSRIEQNTWGQVNPFGLAFDSLGNLYSADCHSEPAFQLLRGGYYPSFGKPHDGLGFAPSMIFHEHGSTAISGIVFYEGDEWPEEYRNNILTGNVMTGRVNRDVVTFIGSTPLANHKPDFLSTDDPWFRPVNLQLGPDSALYIADFYNRIIGHYEVPLDHPGRDRTSGRIWRIVYKGENSKPKTQNPKLPDDLNGLVGELGSPNLTRRMLAMNEISDRLRVDTIKNISNTIRDLARKDLGEGISNPEAFQWVHALWLVARIDPVRCVDKAWEASKARNSVVRTHAMRVFASRGFEYLDGTSPTRALTELELRSTVVKALKDPDALVQRCAAEALGAWPVFDNLKPLLELRHSAPAADTHLIYVVRKAIRDQLNIDEVFKQVASTKWSEQDERALADAALGVKSSTAGTFLLAHIQKYQVPRDALANFLRHVARYVPVSQMDQLAAFTRQKFSDDIDLQLTLFKSVQEGTAQRGAVLGAGTRSWGDELVERLLASVDEGVIQWSNTPIEGMTKTTNPWFVQKRASADNDKTSLFLCSLPSGGEQLTGILRSKLFGIPAKLDFFMAGHDGSPDKPANKKNLVRLRAAATREILAETFPPRNDTAQPFSWDLAQHAGKSGYLEIVDGDNGGAFAWLAVGRFDPQVVPLPTFSPSQVAQRQQAAAELARTLSLTKLEPQLAKLLTVDTTDFETRAAVARTLVTFNPNEYAAALASVIGDPGLPKDLRQKISHTLVSRNSMESHAVLVEAMRGAPYRLQVKLAQTLAGSASGAENLLALIEQGQATPRLLLVASLKNKLLATKPVDATQRIEKLTRNLTPAGEQIEKLVEQRRGGYVSAKASSVEGARLYKQNCSVCHRIDGNGGLVGPQLDGIGNRGLERLVEDVLDPNRNVDRAFRTHLITLKNGDVISGLPRREEGEVLALADSTGKEISIAKTDIQERRESETSLMPENFGEILSPEDFNHLMAYLLSEASAGVKQP